MNRQNKTYRILTAGAAAAVMGAALVMTGCSATGSTVTLPDTIKVQNTDSSDTITVTGTKEVQVTPDMAEIAFSVSSQASTASSCQEANNRDVTAAIETLKGLGVDEKSIQTSSYGLQPIRDWNSSTQKITGYQMETSLTVSDIPIDQAGTIISQSVAAGINGIDSVNYFSSTYDASYQEALKGAMAVAQAKAEAIAAAGGQTLGAVVHVEEQGYNPSARYSRAMLNSSSEAGAVADEMAVMPGQISVEATVIVDFDFGA
ncbi:MAG: SIMPL domain-containing protein [Eubacteriales bacterium]|nr:SIMPL domain-containing protein [Eubacteriales bacterium]